MEQTLWMALQPIVSLSTGYVIGHEALVRGSHGSLHEFPSQIFASASANGQLAQVEAECRRLALDATSRIPENQILFVNVDLSFNQVAPLPFNSDHLIAPERLAIEISEHNPVNRESEAQKQINQWHSEGYRIVLDDYGAGYSSLGMAFTVRPHIIKLDRTIIANLDQDEFRVHVLNSVVALWHDRGVQILAEGVETPEELHALLSLGVDYGQGFLFGRPAFHPLVGQIPGWVQWTGSRGGVPPAPSTSPHRSFLTWSTSDHNLWIHYQASLPIIHERFIHLAHKCLNHIEPPCTDAQRALITEYGRSLAQNPTNPVVRDSARLLGRAHIRAGLPPSWFVTLYNLYFQAFHFVEKEYPGTTPPLKLFRRRWLWDLSQTLDNYHERITEQVQEMANQATSRTYALTHDPLTGLSNRHALEEAWEAHGSNATNARQESLIVIDLDDFASINRRLGRSGADLVLHTVGQEISALSPHPDLAARLGGDEFCLWIPYATTSSDTATLFERLCHYIYNTYRLTFSAGIVQPQAPTFQETLFLAYQTLRIAKFAGKCRWVDNHTQTLHRIRTEATSRSSIRMIPNHKPS